jgi:hypothetical protein
MWHDWLNGFVHFCSTVRAVPVPVHVPFLLRTMNLPPGDVVPTESGKPAARLVTVAPSCVVSTSVGTEPGGQSLLASFQWST